MTCKNAYDNIKLKKSKEDIKLFRVILTAKDKNSIV